jgi:SAM-dependent methyltransferase
MLTRAAARGLVTVEGTAEALPFGRSCFDHVLVVTTICFVDSPSRMIDEAHRVLRPRGKIVIAFIDREGLLGRHYLAHQSESIFYRDAVFYSAPEVDELLRQGSFVVRAWGQTLFRPLAEVKEIEPLRAGKGRGSFVVVEAERAEGHWPDEGAPRLVS